MLGVLRVFLIGCVLLLAGDASARRAIVMGDTSVVSVAKSLREARKCAELYDFECAEQHYVQALRQEPDNRSANAEYGLILSKFLRKKDVAIPHLEKSLKGASSGDSLPELLFELAASYQYMGRFEEAKKNYQAVFPSCRNNDEGRELRKKLNVFISQCEYAKSYTLEEGNHQVINLGEAVNSAGPEYIPVYLEKDSTILFTARRLSYQNTERDYKDGKFYEEIYEAKKLEGSISSARPVDIAGGHQEETHQSVVSVAPDGKTLILAINGKLYTSEYVNGKLTEPKDLGPNINCSQYQNHAVMSTDGKSIYFSSDSKSGFGGLDIFRSELQSDGTWGPGINLGDQINTPDDEESPAISQDGNTLYFSSRGLPGFGGYDMFSAEWNGTTFAKVKNLGPPVNSPADDLYLTLNPDGKSGMFSSGRSAGMGDMDIYLLVFRDKMEETACVYSENIRITAPEMVLLQDPFSAVLELAAESPVSLAISWRVDGQEMTWRGMKVDSAFTVSGNHTIHAEAVYFSNGSMFKLCAEKNVIVADKLLVVASETGKNTTAEVDNVNTTLNETSPELLAVYFAYDRSDLSQEAIAALAANVKILRDHPELKITVSGHADSRGSDDYNLALSQRRLNSAVQYLVKNGISRDRIVTKSAKGETEPVNACSDGQVCVEDEYRLNRRVDFKLVK